MSRYQNVITPVRPATEAMQNAYDYMSAQGFVPCAYKGEANVFKRGIGLLTPPQYIKIELQGNSILINAFIKYPIMVGVYVGEMGIKGFMGWGIKVVLKRHVKQIENILIS